MRPVRHLRIIRRFIRKDGQAMATIQDTRTKRIWTTKSTEGKKP